jgi:hypothetical protein
MVCKTVAESRGRDREVRRSVQTRFPNMNCIGKHLEHSSLGF